MRVVVLSDTHVRDGGTTRLPDSVWDTVHAADVIVHAGDVTGRELLEQLAAEARVVHAVLGNNDHTLLGVLPEVLELELGGVRVAVVHDSGPTAGRAARLRRRFPDAQLVIFGHSHTPWNEDGIDGQRLFNPGSATQRRRQPHRTFGVLELEQGIIRSAEIVVAD